MDWNGDGKVDLSEELFTIGLLKQNSGGGGGRGRGNCGCCLLPCVLLLGAGLLSGVGIYKAAKRIRNK